MGLWPPLAILTILFIDKAFDWSRHGLLSAAIADATAHLLTALLLLVAIPRRMPPYFIIGALSAALLIDLDHLPLVLGFDLLTRQTGRPVTHAIWTIALTFILAVATRNRVRFVLFGVSYGLIAHFARDLASTSAGVPLLWPVITHGFTIPFGAHVALLLACWAAFVWQSRSHFQLTVER